MYELLGGPTRDRVRVYAHVGNSPERLKERKAQGFTAFKTGIKNSTQSGIIANQSFVEEAVAAFVQTRGVTRAPGQERRAPRLFVSYRPLPVGNSAEFR